VDLIFGPFAETFLSSFDGAQLDRFEALLDCAEPDRFDWVTGRLPPPFEHDHDVMRRLRTDQDLEVGLIDPPQSAILEASLHVAERVATFIFDQGLAGVPRPDDVGELIRRRAYHPIYPE
jgi:hypothetical protein